MDKYELLSANGAQGPHCWLFISSRNMTVSTPSMSAAQARELAAKLTACADEMEPKGAQPIPFRGFNGCEFSGPPPAGFEAWNLWADQPVLSGVRITRLGGGTISGVAREISEITAEMRERKINHGRAGSPTLVSWASRIDGAIEKLAGAQA